MSMLTTTEATLYFSGTLRIAQWEGFGEEAQATAINEAGMQIGLLPLARPPQRNVDNAIAEQALHLLAEQLNGPSKAMEAARQGIKSRSVLNASESYASRAELQKDPGWINGVYYSPYALMWLWAYLRTSDTVKTGRMVMANGY